MSDFVYGRNPVLESFRGQYLTLAKLRVLKSAQGRKIDKIIQLANERTVEVDRVDRNTLEELINDDRHQGVVARIRNWQTLSMDELIELPSERSHRRILVLDQLKDPVNIGKLARVSLYFDVIGIVKTTDRTAPLSETVLRTSAGAAARIPFVEVTNLRRGLEALQDDRFWMVGLDVDSERSIDDVPYDRDLALILGEEGSGIRRLTRDQSDFVAKISGTGRFQSLNVATAGSIAIHTLQSIT